MILTNKTTDDGTEILDLVDNALGFAGVRENVDLVCVLAHIQGGFQTEGKIVGVRSGTKQKKKRGALIHFQTSGICMKN